MNFGTAVLLAQNAVPYFNLLKGNKFMKKILAVLLAAVLLLTAFSACSNTGTKEPESIYDTPVMQVGDMQYTLNDINYMYVSIFNQVYTQLYYYVGSGISNYVDVKADLSEQNVSEEQTWDDYIRENIEYSIKDMTALYLAAKEEGFELTGEYKTNIDSIKSDLENAAEEYGTSLEDYITAMYGPGMDYDTVYKMSEISYYAAAYAEAKQDSMEVTEQEMRDRYEANKNDYDTVSFRFCSFYYGDDIENYTDEDVAAYRAKAEAVADAKTVDEFKAAVIENVAEDKKENYEADSATLYSGAKYTDIGYDGLADWLFASERKAGDTMVYEDETNGGFIPVMFVERVSADYEPVDVRHILIMPEKGDDGTASDEAWAAAETKAKEVLEEFLAGDKTEETFAKLAEEKSEDGGSNTNGGLYSGVTKGQMVAPFEEWCFAEGRQPGDTDIVKTSYGYHVMYFSGRGENNIYSSLKSTLVTEKFDNWLNGLSDALEVTKLDGFEQVGGMIAGIAQAAEDHAAAQEEESGAQSDTESGESSGESTSESTASENSTASEESASSEG